MSAVLTPTETHVAPMPPAISTVSRPLEASVSPVVAEARFVLPDVSWATYEQLLANYENSGGPRFTYNNGALEIFMPSQSHEETNRLFEVLVSAIAEGRDLDLRSLGSTTNKSRELLKGVEPDSCFYIQSYELIANLDNIDLRQYPPDLVIEIDVTSPSLDKFPIYAALGVPEIWHHQNGRTKIFALQAGAYQEAAASQALTGVTGAILDQFLAASRDTRRPAWLRGIREWAQGKQE